MVINASVAVTLLEQRVTAALALMTVITQLLLYGQT